MNDAQVRAVAASVWWLSHRPQRGRDTTGKSLPWNMILPGAGRRADQGFQGAGIRGAWSRQEPNEGDALVRTEVRAGAEASEKGRSRPLTLDVSVGIIRICRPCGLVRWRSSIGRAADL